MPCAAVSSQVRFQAGSHAVFVTLMNAGITGTFLRSSQNLDANSLVNLIVTYTALAPELKLLT